MFGHGVFDIPMKTFNASPYCEDNPSGIEEVIGCPPYLGDFYDDYDPEAHTWTNNEQEDREYALASDQYDVKQKQATDIGMGIVFQVGGYGPNHELRWCHDLGKYGTKLYWWLYNKDDASTHMAKNSYEASALSHNEIKGLMDTTKDILEGSQENEGWTVKEVDCADEGMEENESFDYGPAVGSGDAGDSDEDEEEPEDPASLKSYYLPIVLILAGGAAYYYKDQLIQVSKRIM